MPLQVGRLDLRSIVAGFVDSLVSLEQPLLRTTGHLMIRPGEVARRWIGGARRSYTSPVKFLVVVGLIVALAYQPLLDLGKHLHPQQRLEYRASLVQHASQYFALFCLLLLLPFSLVLRGIGALLGVSRSWLEWYVLGLYAYGVAAGVQLLATVVTTFFPAGSWTMHVALGKGLLPVVWLCWGAWGFVPSGRRIRALVVALLAQAGVVFVLALVQHLLQ